MRWIESARRWLRTRVRRPDERELDEELRLHLELEIEENLRRGLSPGEARRRALAAFGRVEDVKDDVRDVRPLARWLGDLRRDARIALRSLPRQPVFAAAVVLTLGIGIGGDVAMLGVLDAALFRTLPYPEPERLVFGRVTYDGEVGRTVSGPDFFDTRERTRTLASLSAITPFPVEATVTGGAAPERVQAPLVSSGLFETLGVRPFLGRDFTHEEGEPGGPPVAVLSNAFWQRRLGEDFDVIGTTIALDGVPTTIVGVMPPGFRFLVDADAWRPIQRGIDWAAARQFHNFVLVGRLAPGVPFAAAQAEVDVISRQLAAAYPDTNEGKGIRLTPLREALGESVRGPLDLLLAAVTLVLVVACANAAGLLVARGSARRQEMAVRTVMGARRARLARQLLTENGLLALGAAGLGILLSLGIQRGVLAFLPTDALGPLRAGLSGSMIAAAILLALATLALFGVLPAIRMARSEPASELRSGRRTTSGRGSARTQRILVVAQVAMTSVLVIVSGLLLRSFLQLRGVDPGFDAEGLLTAEVALPAGTYGHMAERLAFFERLRERATALPGVSAVGVVDRLPVRDGGGNVRVSTPEEWGSGGVFERLAYQRRVLPGYFQAMGIPLLSGRDVTRGDERDAPNVMLVSASLADDLFPDEDAVGRVLAVDIGEAEPWIAEVVGIVGDVVPNSLAEGTDYAMYFSYAQRSAASMRLAIRTHGDRAGITSGLRDILGSLDPELPLAGVVSMDEVLATSLAGRRSVMTVLLAFAGVALLLAAVGLYGLMAYHVSRRVHEIGVRIALGAPTSTVALAVLRRGLGLVAAGLAVALPLSLAAGRFVQDMLFGVGGLDLLTWAGTAAFLSGVATLACLLPARRAAVVDPMEALRAE